MFLIAASGWTCLPILVVWLANNLKGRKERIVGLAVVIGGGQSGNLVAANVFVTGQEKRGFKGGMASGLGVVLLGMVCAVILTVGLWLENRKLEREEQESGGEEGVKGFRNTL